MGMRYVWPLDILWPVGLQRDPPGWQRAFGGDEGLDGQGIARGDSVFWRRRGVGMKPQREGPVKQQQIVIFLVIYDDLLSSYTVIMDNGDLFIWIIDNDNRNPDLIIINNLNKSMFIR